MIVVLLEAITCSSLTRKLSGFQMNKTQLQNEPNIHSVNSQNYMYAENTCQITKWTLKFTQ